MGCMQIRNLGEMENGAKIYVAGHRGLVGAAIVRALEKQGFNNLLLRTHKELDLTRQAAVEDFFHKEKPDYVVLAAAKVGGIHANSTYPAEFIAVNLQIQTNVIDAAYKAGVKKLLFLGSSCIYPKFAPQPIAEDSLLTGPLEPTNEWYAVAKISGIKMCQVSGSSKNAQVDVNLATPTSIADTSFGLFHEKCQLEIALHYSMDVIALIICLTV